MTEQEWILRCKVFSSARNWPWPTEYSATSRPWEKESEILKITLFPVYWLNIEASILINIRNYLWFKSEKEVLFRRTHHLMSTNQVSKDFWGIGEVLWQSIYEKSISSQDRIYMDFLESSFSKDNLLHECIPKKYLDHLCGAWESITEEIREAAAKKDIKFRLLRETVRIFESKAVVGISYKNRGSRYVALFNLCTSRIHIAEK